MKILVVEDEKKTAAFLQRGLTESGYVVDIASDGIEGFNLSQSREYDLIVLDVMLPGMEGWSIVKRLREAGNQTPVIFLTARDDVQDRIMGLELGADDYIVKPFAFSELLARMQTILRRGVVAASDVLRIADLELDVVRYRVTRAGKRIDLTPKEFVLLSLLLRKAGEVLSRTRIAERVWDMEFTSDTNVVDVHMKRLRAKVDDPFPRKLIHTVRGIGYVLEERE